MSDATEARKVHGQRALVWRAGDHLGVIETRGSLLSDHDDPIDLFDECGYPPSDGLWAWEGWARLAIADLEESVLSMVIGGEFRRLTARETEALAAGRDWAQAPDTSESERYPLWCWDTGRFSEERYLGPYDTKAEAREDYEPRSPDVTLRRCREIAPSEVLEVNAPSFDDEFDPADWPSDAWADWESVVTVPDAEAFEREFAALVRKHVAVGAFICEGDEDQ